MTCLLQVSDPHFGTEQPQVVAALERLAEAQRPDVLVLSGDITQRATRDQFASARRFVERLGVPAGLAVPGNHDIPLYALGTRLFDPYSRYREAFGDELEPVVDLPDCLLIGVNCTRWYRHENGEVSREQIERVAARLAQPIEGSAPGQPSHRLRIVVLHQPVAVTRPKDIPNLLVGREHAVRRWAEAGADLILGGHIHLPYVLSLERSFDRLPRKVWCVQAGTAVSSRVRADAPNSVNLIRPMPLAARSEADGSPGLQPAGGPAVRRCTVERWDFSTATGGFERVGTHALDLTLDRAPAAAMHGA
ncbi:putative DNA repair exonuclease [Burkholderiales bacterium 8X]|nr:putative DNA repair exonuclease [Burkholderiales bacterium 8X]